VSPQVGGREGGGSPVVPHAGTVARVDRRDLLGLSGATVWFTGLSGSGKSSLAVAVEERLVASGRAAYRLDGDTLRTGLNADLGFGRAQRDENVRRVAHVAALFADAGIVALVALISPYAAGRLAARTLHQQAGLPFLEVYLSAPAEICAARDPKGLYARASSGKLSSFTGIDDPYEPPAAPEVAIGPERSLDEAADLVLGALRSAGSWEA
jgi:bifunctional enzyme CysN/CysC